ncbi:MAG: rod shape-determining protein MreD [Candidatus Pelagibacter sp. TMED273]|nr:MAG: rod shape-determining protein MreD [Candidatus Pelagibacter sp. TMED273]
MTEFTNKNIFRVLYLYLPIILLFISVLNEFDFNYMNFKYFSFNFPYILIFYWSLKKPDYLGYGLIFISGLFNDVVIGTPIGLSSFSYLLICGFAAYLRYITLRPSLTKDWIFFLVTIIFVNSINFLILEIFFTIKMDLVYLSINIILTFLFYIIFANIFDIYQKVVFGKTND